MALKSKINFESLEFFKTQPLYQYTNKLIYTNANPLIEISKMLNFGQNIKKGNSKVKSRDAMKVIDIS